MRALAVSGMELIKINYKLYKPTDETLTPLQQVLYDRGIPVEKQNHWLNAGWDDINDFSLLENAENAANKIIEYCKNNKNITVIQDSDVDGMTSTAIICNYIYKVFNIEPIIILHDGKQHGLADLDLDAIAAKTDLLIIPDAGSNDYDQHKYLHDKGVGIVIADHHECDEYSEYAITVNNQMCDYPNKNLSGAGVMWQVCQAMDSIIGCEYANDFLDLCALGNLSDMMDYISLETRAIVRLGLSNIQNTFLKGFVEKQAFSLNKMNGLNYLSCAFYVTPYCNAMCRSGEEVEKRLLMNALLYYKCEKTILSSKRGEKGKEVPLWQEAITTIERVKRRQTKLQDEAMEFLEYQIQEKKLTDNAIIACVCGPDDIPAAICGLAANKIQAKYQHPTLVLREVEEEDGIHLKGSARNYSYCPIEDMRSLCEKTGLTDFAQGHTSAFGVSLPLEDYFKFIDKTNEEYQGIDFEPVYYVDYIWNYMKVSANDVLAIAALNIYGQGIPESKVVVRDIDLDNVQVQLLGETKGHPTIKISLPTGVDIMKFRSSREEFEEWTSGDKQLTIIGKCSRNEWNGTVTPQILIDDFELKEDEEEWVF